MLKDEIKINKLIVSAYVVPTEFPESDGTLEWKSTTLILVELEGGGKKGMGYTYGDASVAYLVDKSLKQHIVGEDLLQISFLTQSLIRTIRNIGNCGIAAMAISAINNALWDLKAKVLDQPLAMVLGMVRNEVKIYGSGGFTSYPMDKLQQQLGGWAEEGIAAVKMKIGRQWKQDVERVQAARKAIGDHTALFVDANGAYTTRQAIMLGEQFAALDVTWYEEPVPSHDLEGLQFIRQKIPASINIAAGEYGYNLPYFEQMLDAGAVDILQADVSRCGGISTFLKAGHLCEARHLPFSSHCAPALHLHAALALPAFYMAEYFYDHVRIENMLFDGVPRPVKGALQPDLTRPGLGLEVKRADAERYRIS